MRISPIVSASQLSDLGPLRLLYVPTAEERPAGMAVVPIRDWIAVAKQSDTGFDDVPYWQDQIAQLGLTRDALTVVLDDGGMTEAARVWASGSGAERWLARPADASCTDDAMHHARSVPRHRCNRSHRTTGVDVSLALRPDY